MVAGVGEDAIMEAERAKTARHSPLCAGTRLIAQWASEEFSSIDLHDERRNRRAKLILTQLQSVGEAAPESAKGITSAALDGLYRFMRNDAISPEKLLQPHQEAAIKRTRERQRVMLVQDTTEVDLTKPSRQVDGAGLLSSKGKHGFYLHLLVAYCEGGVPLGVVGAHHWTRSTLNFSDTHAAKKKQRDAKPVEEKESYRWVEMVRRGKQIAQENPGTAYVGVSDSESDITDVFGELATCPENYQLLIRACQNRAVNRGEDNPTARYLEDAVSGAAVRFRRTIHVRERQAMTGVEARTRRTKRIARDADVEVRSVEVTLTVRVAASSSQDGKARTEQLKVNVVQVRETDPPAGEDPVEWILVTTMPIGTDQELDEVINAYKI